VVNSGLANVVSEI